MTTVTQWCSHVGWASYMSTAWALSCSACVTCICWGAGAPSCHENFTLWDSHFWPQIVCLFAHNYVCTKYVYIIKWFLTILKEHRISGWQFRWLKLWSECCLLKPEVPTSIPHNFWLLTFLYLLHVSDICLLTIWKEQCCYSNGKSA